MAEFEMNGRRYRELPDGRVQDIGPAGGQGTYIPPSARTERKKDAEADKAAADAAAAAGAAPYAAPTAAANLTGTNLDNAITTDRKRVVKGKSVSVRVNLGGRRINKKKK